MSKINQAAVYYSQKTILINKNRLDLLMDKNSQNNHNSISM